MSVIEDIRVADGRKYLWKAPTGIPGLDEITGGGLPQGPPPLVCGTAGCGKTLSGIEFLVRGACQFNEPGVLVAPEETGEELAQNVPVAGLRSPHAPSPRAL